MGYARGCGAPVTEAMDRVKRMRVEVMTQETRDELTMKSMSTG